MFNPEKFGRAMRKAIDEKVQKYDEKLVQVKEESTQQVDAFKAEVDGLQDTIKSLVSQSKAQQEQVEHLQEELANALSQIKALPAPKQGEKGDKGDKGDKGADGLSISGAFVSLHGELVLVQSDGATKNLGHIVGADGKDGESITDLQRLYDAETHEIVETWTTQAGTKELRYPAGGLVARGFWEKGVKAKAGDVYTHNGSAWAAKKDTDSEPAYMNTNWHLLVRKGADAKTQPIKV